MESHEIRGRTDPESLRLSGLAPVAGGPDPGQPPRSLLGGVIAPPRPVEAGAAGPFSRDRRTGLDVGGLCRDLATGVGQAVAALDRGAWGEVRHELEAIRQRVEGAARAAERLDVTGRPAGVDSPWAGRQVVDLNAVVARAVTRSLHPGPPRTLLMLDPARPHVIGDVAALEVALDHLLGVLVRPPGGTPLAVETVEATGVVRGERVARVRLGRAADPPAEVEPFDPGPALTVVAAHGGTWAVTPRSGGGLVVTLELPAV